MTREEKKRNKEHCKGRRFNVRLQCWYFRNRMEITVVLLSVVTSILTNLAIIGLFSAFYF